MSTEQERQVDEAPVVGSSDTQPQDAYYSYVPPLCEELALLVLARVPRSEYWKLCNLDSRYLALISSGKLHEIRKEIGIKEPFIFVLASGEDCWWAFDWQFDSCKKLPVLPSDLCFAFGDKESLCVGSNLLVWGREINGVVMWRYEMATDRWCRGSSMVHPRCLFASASSGSFAYVAGGVGMEADVEIVSSSEKYNINADSWEPLPNMNRRRKLCSGCYMDNKFFVIGGQSENGIVLTCGEFYNEDWNKWVLIPDMLKDDSIWSSRSPPLVAVVNNELYSLEASSNRVKLYLKRSNSWKELGRVPVRADRNRGWGVAFKSLGDELLIIGEALNSSARYEMIICTCCPDPDADVLQWKFLGNRGNRMNHFIFNCSVSVA